MCMNPFPQQNQSYQFYYDESNNVRKLYLSKQIDGYNIDHDPDKHNSVNFVLAGVAHTCSSSSADFDDLRKRIQLQANAKEFKLKHLAKGDFLTMLTSKKLTAFFEWLLYGDLYLHYFHLNMEFLRLLINKSHDNNPTLLHCVVSALEHEKHKAFTYPDEP